MTLFLGTGCGRSGTLWTAKFFNALGVDTLHETQFAPDVHGPLRQSEVSWLAIPYAGKRLPEGTPLLRVVRNPYASVMSVMQTDFQQKRRATPFDRFLAQHRPDIVRPADKITRSIRYVASWDRPLNDLEHEVIRPDADDAERLRHVVRYATGKDVSVAAIEVVRRTLGRKVNTKIRSRPEVTREDIRAHPEGWKIRQRAERFGYV